jgi:hypothetical protein
MFFLKLQELREQGRHSILIQTLKTAVKMANYLVTYMCNFYSVKRGSSKARNIQTLLSIPPVGRQQHLGKFLDAVKKFKWIFFKKQK